MGNRAVITFDPQMKQDSLGVYLHWCGSPEQVEAILAKLRGYARSPDDDASYAFARLVEACCEAEGPYSETGCGAGLLHDLDTNNYDNGTYVVGGDWKVVKHVK